MTPKRITIHCSDSPNGRLVTVDEIRKWHTDPPPKGRGWSDIGYHFVIYPDGSANDGRPITEQGAHVEGANEDNIGICMVGKDQFTAAQFRGLRQLLTVLCSKFKISSDKILGHYEFQSAIAQGKTCPNMNMDNVLFWYVNQDDAEIKAYILTGAQP